MRPISELAPAWLAEGHRHRYQMGMEMDCPTHGPSCRLQFWFSNPCDGERPIEGKPLFHRINAALVDLIVLPSDHWAQTMLTIPGHWCGWIVEGEVFTMPEERWTLT